MSEYIIKCMPYLNEYSASEGAEKSNTDNVFNVKETVGLKRSDIFRDYLIEVENQNISRPTKRLTDECPTCKGDGQLVHFPETSDLVCERCGVVVTLVGQDGNFGGGWWRDKGSGGSFGGFEAAVGMWRQSCR